MITSNHIEIYGKQKYAKLLNNLLTKSRLYDIWFNKMILAITSEYNIKIIILPGTHYRQRLYGKAINANIIFIFIDEMTIYMKKWWKELFLCVTIHEIMHLAQNTKEYYNTLRYIPMAEKQMEQDADLMTYKILKNTSNKLELNTSLHMKKFLKKVAINILDTSEILTFHDNIHPNIKNNDELIMNGIYNEIDSNPYKLKIKISDIKINIFNRQTNCFNINGINFFFYYTEFYKIKYNEDALIQKSKFTYSLKYDKDIYKIGLELLI